MGVFKHIFTPIKIGNMTVKNRIEFPPVGPLLAANGLVSRELIEWGRQFARGGVGIVTLGDSAIIQSENQMGGSALNLGSDRAINPLNTFAEAVQRYGAKASIQLNHHVFFSPDSMTLEDIRTVIASFADAAYRCLSAGMDMVMIHGAHGQLISQFVSGRRNQRTDAYGGSLQNRARFAVEILEAIRSKVGDRLALEYRISGEELAPGGLTLDEQVEFTHLIQDKINLIHVSAGKLYEPDTLPKTIQPTYFPRGMNVALAARFKRELKIPVVAVGSLDLALAEQIVADNKADIAALARTLIADPDCIHKASRGEEDTIRPCVRCNTCINRTHSQRLPVHCAVNPLIGREAELANLLPPTGKRKVVVVGGGPAGMEAARRAAARGHQVVLFEKDPMLGGTLKLASAPPFKEDMHKYLDWSIRTTLNTPGLHVKLSTEADGEEIRAEKPDVLIIAAGAEPLIPKLQGIVGRNVIWAGDAVTGRMSVGDRVLIAGAGLTGSETALYLAQLGKRVTLVDILPLEQVDADSPLISLIALRRMLAERDVKVKTGVKLAAVTPDAALLSDQNGERTAVPCDTVVLALGMEPRTLLIDSLKDMAPEVHVIGDCRNAKGNLYHAVTEGFFAGTDI